MVIAPDSSIGAGPGSPCRSALVEGLKQAENDVLAELEYVRAMLERALAAAVACDREGAATVEAGAAELSSLYRGAHEAVAGADRAPDAGRPPT